MDPDVFWQQTPAEIRRICGARVKHFQERADLSLEQLTYAAWRIADLSGRKKLPKLKKLLDELRKSRVKPAQTMAQQIAIAQMWAALGYGKIKSIHQEKS